MIYSRQSSRSPEQVETSLREAAARHRFGILNVQDLRKTLAGKGLELGSECRIYDLCNPQAAIQALQAAMEVSTILPCRISVTGSSSGSVIATVAPTSLFRATGLQGQEDLAAEIEQQLLSIIDEAAAS